MHAQVGLQHDAASFPMQTLSNQSYFAFCGIGNPQTFERRLATFASPVGHRWFADHHCFTEADLESLDREQCHSRKNVLVTTEKDAVKFSPVMHGASGCRSGT